MLEMPFDQELETMIIGNVLLMKRMTVEDKKIYVPDFYSVRNQKIWQVMCELDEDGASIEILDIHAKLKDEVKVTELANMTMGLVGDTRSEDVARLKTLATLRNLIKNFSKMARMAEKQASVDEILTENVSMLDQMRSEQEKRHGTSQHIIEVMEHEVFPRLDKFVSGELVKIPFGFDKLDDSCNGGASLGELVLFGALPKSGKSCLALQIARNIAQLNIPSMIISREMLNYENGFRFIAQSSNYSVNVFRSDMHALTADRLKEHAQAQYNIPLYLDSQSRTLKDIAREVQRRKDEDGLTAVFVDYVQLVQSDNSRASRAEKLEEIVYGLKDLAVKHEIVVYANAQFNREGIKSDRPTLAHFDGSSAIEKAANLALLWTLEKDFDQNLDGRKGQMWIEAGRSVANDEFDIVFHGKTSRFSFL